MEPLFTYEERNILECLVWSKIQSLKESIGRFHDKVELTPIQSKVLDTLQKDLEEHKTLLEKLKNMEVK